MWTWQYLVLMLKMEAVSWLGSCYWWSLTGGEAVRLGESLKLCCQSSINNYKAENHVLFSRSSKVFERKEEEEVR